MKILKRVAIVFLVYVAIVVAFESMIGVFQPAGEATLVITTMDADGASHDRVLAALESEGHLYVAANHWPRSWYNQALANPNVQIVQGEEEGAYLAVPVEGAEHDQVKKDNGVGVIFRLLTGFPSRYFVRLDPL